jgi:hypothetical protein
MSPALQGDSHVCSGLACRAQPRRHGVSDRVPEQMVSRAPIDDGVMRKVN